MSILSSFKEHIESGDPTIRTWFLVQQTWMPFTFSAAYVFFVMRLGPYLMRHRQPMDLRKTMVVYNFSVVSVYMYALCKIAYRGLTEENYKMICTRTNLHERKEFYEICSATWLIYIIKYVEYSDTVFFILRKKYHLISHLHVSHHACLPIAIWFLLRTEKTGFQIATGMLNAFVHAIMYTYYGLAAMGPKFQKILWWKRYLTLLQMIQFVLILLLMSVVAPLLKCQSSKEGIHLNTLLAGVFLILFYNFYQKTYKQPLNDKSKDNPPDTVQNWMKQNVDCLNR